MASPKSLSRSKLAAGLFAPAALGVAAVVAVTWSQPEVPTGADPALVSMTSVAECHDFVSIGIGGRGDVPKGKNALTGADGKTLLPAAIEGGYHSHWVDPVINKPVGDFDEDDDVYAAIYIDYPANLASYDDAVTTGVANTHQVMNAIQAACPDTQFAIVGFSEGADVARRAAMQIGTQTDEDAGKYIDPDRVRGVVILSDAGRDENGVFFPGAQNEHGNPDGFDLQYQDGDRTVSGQGALPNTGGGFGALDGRVASFCSEGDFACSTPENISLIRLLVNVGRQVNGDALEHEGLTPATGAQLAQVVGNIGMLALADISANPEWMRSDETFLDVLIKVSAPGYDPAKAGTPAVTPVSADAGDSDADATAPIPSNSLANLAYLPQKLVNEVVGLIRTNQNTLSVILSDPYEQTFGYDKEKDDHHGHHFDYWDTIDGKDMTTADYAAAWLTHLAQEAAEGNKVSTDAAGATTARMISTDEAAAAQQDATPSSPSADTPAPSSDVPATGTSVPAGESPVAPLEAPVVSGPVDGVPPAGTPAAEIPGTETLDTETSGTETSGTELPAEPTGETVVPDSAGTGTDVPQVEESTGTTAATTTTVAPAA